DMKSSDRRILILPHEPSASSRRPWAAVGGDLHEGARNALNRGCVECPGTNRGAGCEQENRNGHDATRPGLAQSHANPHPASSNESASFLSTFSTISANAAHCPPTTRNVRKRSAVPLKFSFRISPHCPTADPLKSSP